MTIPVIPGPFSFLAEAGKAAGAIGEALETRKQRKIAEAQKGLESMLALITAGKLGPSALNSPEAQALLQQARIPVPARIAPEALEDPTTRGNIGRAGVALPSGAPFTPSADDLLRQAKTRALRTLAPGGATEAAVTGVPREPVAGASERTVVAGAEKAEADAVVAGEQARAAPAQADAALAESRARQRIFEDVTAMLGNPREKSFQRIAAFASVGALPFLIQQLETTRAHSTELRNDARLLMQAMDQVQRTILERQQEWQRTAELEALKQNVNLASEREAAAFLQEYEKNFPRPTRETVQAEVLTQFGLTPEGFKAAAATVFPRIFEPGATPPGGAVRTPKPTGAAEPSPGGGTDVIQEAADILAQSPTKATAKLLVDDFHNGGWTKLQMRAILARAKAAGYPDSLIKLIETEIPR